MFAIALWWSEGGSCQWDTIHTIHTTLHTLIALYTGNDVIGMEWPLINVASESENALSNVCVGYISSFCRLAKCIESGFFAVVTALSFIFNECTNGGEESAFVNAPAAHSTHIKLYSLLNK